MTREKRLVLVSWKTADTVRVVRKEEELRGKNLAARVGFESATSLPLYGYPNHRASEP